MSLAEDLMLDDDLHPIDLVETLASDHQWEFDRVTDNQIAMAVEGMWRTYSLTLAWSPSDETLRRPWTGVAVRGPRSLQEFVDLDPRLNQHIQHMMDLPYERVLKAAKKLLAERTA